jgi:hypothetical protein
MEVYHSMSHHTDQNHMSHQRVLEAVQHFEDICGFTEYSILQMEGSSYRREQLKTKSLT